jgi:hypothetical protein
VAKELAEMETGSQGLGGTAYANGTARVTLCQPEPLLGLWGNVPATLTQWYMALRKTQITSPFPLSLRLD